MRLSELKRLIADIEAINDQDPEISMYIEMYDTKVACEKQTDNYFLDFNIKPVVGGLPTYYSLKTNRFEFPLAVR